MERVFATKGQAREQSLLIFLMYISIEDIGNLQVQRRTPECSCLTSLFVASVLAFILVLYPKARTWLLAQNAICASTKIVSQALRWVRSSRYINSPQPTLSEHRVHHTSSSTQILHIPYLAVTSPGRQANRAHLPSFSRQVCERKYKTQKLFPRKSLLPSILGHCKSSGKYLISSMNQLRSCMAEVLFFFFFFFF